MNLAEFRNKRVFLTGHTGFKGAWLAHWLCELGAEVHGYALAPPTEPALFDQLGLAQRLHDGRNDIRDAAAVARAIADAQPDFVFHLAAQPLVRLSYAEPLATYEVNVLGTINVLQALRALTKPCAAVFITTDKCYENREWLHGYREEDPLGGYDPYSSSKAAAEIAIASFRQSFFRNHPVKIASARAGNVIGGGDWALDRIVPDCIRAVQAGKPIPVRNKIATRPWQHVLEPLSGYLWLAASLGKAESGKLKAELGKAELGKAELGKAELGKAELGKAELGKAELGKAELGKAESGKLKAELGKAESGKLIAEIGELNPESGMAKAENVGAGDPAPSLASAFNFGPALASNRTVAELVRELVWHTGGTWLDASDPAALHEASKLNLATDKAFHLLGWQPVWGFEETLAKTAEWYLGVAGGQSPHDLTLGQIRAYHLAASKLGLGWARADP